MQFRIGLIILTLLSNLIVSDYNKIRLINNMECIFEAEIIEVISEKEIDAELAKDYHIEENDYSQMKLVEVKIKLLSVINSKEDENNCANGVGLEDKIKAINVNKKDIILKKGNKIKLQLVVLKGFAPYGIPSIISWYIVP